MGGGVTPVGIAWQQVVCAYLLLAVFLAALPRDRMLQGLATIGVGFLAHSLLAIALTAHDPERSAAVLPQGEAYWSYQESWIRTGVNQEYDPSQWLPAHLQLLGAMVAFTYLSFGLVPFFQGFYEVDLMNYYVGRLVLESDSAGAAVLMGWHAWSVARGLCYTLLVYEVASLSLARLTGRPLASRRWRTARWGVGLSLFALDCLLKYFMLDSVRSGLEGNLLPG